MFNDVTPTKNNIRDDRRLGRKKMRAHDIQAIPGKKQRGFGRRGGFG